MDETEVENEIILALIDYLNQLCQRKTGISSQWKYYPFSQVVRDLAYFGLRVIVHFAVKQASPIICTLLIPYMYRRRVKENFSTVYTILQLC